MTTDNNHEQLPDVKGNILNKFLVQSKTDKTMWYMVDIAAHTCECRYYLETKRECEHQRRAIKHREGENR